MLSSRIWAFCGPVAFIAVACGGIDEPNLFSGGTTTTHTDGGSSTTSDGGTNSKDSGSGTHPDDGGVVTSDSGVKPPPPSGIYCGTDMSTGIDTTCTGGDICCVTGEQIATPSYACGSESPCKNVGDLVVPCDNSAECPSGKICCGTFVTGTVGYYSEVKCASSCNGTSARTFCDPNNGDADCASVSATSTCSASGALPGFHVCSGP